MSFKFYCGDIKKIIICSHWKELPIPSDPGCVLIIRYDTGLIRSTSCASKEYKTFKGFSPFQSSRRLHCFCLSSSRGLSNIPDKWSLVQLLSIELWLHHHWEKVSSGIFPPCFLSFPCGSSSIQGHKHLSSIVFPNEWCIRVISIFFYSLL